MALSVLKGLAAAYEEKEGLSYWRQFGYKFAGIVAYGYARWLKEQFDAAGIERAYFVTRDGLAFKAVFDALYPDFDTRQIYGSRRLFLFACMREYGDIQPCLTGREMPGVTLGDFWELLAVDDEALKRAYDAEFTDQLRFVREEKGRIDAFMKAHESEFRRVGERERKAIGTYYNSIGLGEKKSAIVGLGWTGSLLRGNSQICRDEGISADLNGFYLATHESEFYDLRTASYLLEHGKTGNVAGSEVLCSSQYAINILKTVFSSPEGRIKKLEAAENGVVPVYDKEFIPDEKNRIAQAEALAGMTDFAGDFSQIQALAGFEVARETVLAPVEYLARHVGRRDQVEIEKAYRMSDFPGVGYRTPLFRQDRPTIGVINPWPGDMSAESEVITRMRRGAEENGINLVALDNFAHILDEKQKMTQKFVDSEDLDFVITTHYETPKIIDAFAYHTVWNPPEIPMNLDYYTERVTDQYVMNDDFLIYDFGGMSNHLRSMLMCKPRTLEGASMLTASFPASAMLEPKLDNPVMFYCGMNWESVNGIASRHGGLFQLLDRTKKVKFFGPEKVEAWGGIRPWEGYECYQHSIPFDGFSIVREINECGVCLVLSSDIHRRAGSATNRLYEACAAGAVMISDENEFMLRYFGDAALFINYNKNDPEDTFHQLMEKYEWIVTHPEEALKIARRAQKVFRERFSLDAQLLRIIERHPLRFDQIKQDLFAKDESKTVLTTFVLNTRKEEEIGNKLSTVISNIRKQYYPNIELGIACDTAVYDAVRAYCEQNCLFATPVSMKLYDGKGARAMTDGQAIRTLQKAIAHDYFIMTNEAEIWFSDHVTTLIRSIEDSGSLCAYAGIFGEDHVRYRRVWLFNRFKYENLFLHIGEYCVLRVPGIFLFAREASDYVPDYVFDCLDGKEYFAYADLLHYKHNRPLVFSHRMTIGFLQEEKIDQFFVLDEKRQVRFIQDLVRYYLPEATSTTNVVNQSAENQGVANISNISDSVSDMLIRMPLKTLIKLRYHQAMMHKLPGNSKCRKKHEEKHRELVSQLHNFWK